jgi:hypothetical protein
VIEDRLTKLAKLTLISLAAVIIVPAALVVLLMALIVTPFVWLFDKGMDVWLEIEMWRVRRRWRRLAKQ